MKEITLPCDMAQRLPREDAVVNIRLKDGRILRDILCKEGRTLRGRVVGGHPGVVMIEFDFGAEDIIDVKAQTWCDTIAPLRVVKERFGIL